MESSKHERLNVWKETSEEVGIDINIFINSIACRDSREEKEKRLAARIFIRGRRRATHRNRYGLRALRKYVNADSCVYKRMALWWTSRLHRELSRSFSPAIVKRHISARRWTSSDNCVISLHKPYSDCTYKNYLRSSFFSFFSSFKVASTIC